MKTNFKTLDRGYIDNGRYARLVSVAQGTEHEYVVIVYTESGDLNKDPMGYGSQMRRVEHFTDEQEATMYFLALMDPEEFGNPEKLLKELGSRIPQKSYKWTPDVAAAVAIAREAFKREVKW